jgi:hypothetical protein
VILVNEQADFGHGFRTMIEGVPGIQSHGVTGAGSMFVLPAQPGPREPPVEPALPARARDAGRYLLELDLGAARHLSAIAFPLRQRYEDLSSRMRIETSMDGAAWSEAWSGWTGGLAFEATLADPQVAPMRIPLPGVRARYVRVYPASTWMRTEMTVQGR